jgi:hypothetical protein
MCIGYCCTKFNLRRLNCSLLIVIELKDKENVRPTAILYHTKIFPQYYLHIFPWSVTGHYLEYPKVIAVSTSPASQLCASAALLLLTARNY